MCLRPTAARRVVIGLVLLGIGSPPAPAQSVREGAGAPELLIYKADALAAAGQLLEADQQYRYALERVPAHLHRNCLEGLMRVQRRLGRHDQVVHFGSRLLERLRQTNDTLPLREVMIHVGEAYLSLGHHPRGERLLLDSLKMNVEPPLPPLTAATARAALARLADQRFQNNEALKLWREVQKDCNQALDDPRRDQQSPERIRCRHLLAEAYRGQQEHEKASRLLQGLLRLHERLEDPLGQRDTLRELARMHDQQLQQPQAEQCLRQALKLQKQYGRDDLETLGDLWSELAAVQRRPIPGPAHFASAVGQMVGLPALWQLGWLAQPALKAWQADSSCSEAIRLYQAALQKPQVLRPDRSGVPDAFWKLHQLYLRRQQRESAQAALVLLKQQAGWWSADYWMNQRLKAEEGVVQTLLQDFRKSRPLLEQTLAELKQQKPPDHLQQIRTMLCLALIERMTFQGEQGNQDRQIDQTRTLAQACLDLYQQNQLPDDLGLATTRDLLGYCAYQAGQNKKAMEHFVQGIACCERLGEQGNQERSQLYLGVTLLHLTQNETDEALDSCQRAKSLLLLAGAAEAEILSLVDCALIEIHLARSEYKEANTLAQRLRETLDRQQKPDVKQVLTARHAQAAFQLKQRQVHEAIAEWKKMLPQQKENNDPLRVRTLNFLGLAAEMQGQTQQAHEYYQQAREEADKMIVRPPLFQKSISLWRLANLDRNEGRLEKGIQQLTRAVDIAEQLRQETSGAFRQRAAFLVQFSPSLDQLVSWNLQAGRRDLALLASVRSRGRAWLDQLQLAGADPLQAIKDEPKGKELVEKEQAQRQVVDRLQARMLQLRSPSEQEARKLAADLIEAQRKSELIWREIYDLDPRWQKLAEKDPADQLLEIVQKKVLKGNQRLLVYHLGLEESVAFLIGPGDREIEIYRLEVSEALLRDVSRVVAKNGAGAGPLVRGVEIEAANPNQGPRGIEVEQADQNQPPGKGGPPQPDRMLPLTKDRATPLVQFFHQMLQPGGSLRRRGIAVEPANPKLPPPVARGDLIERLAPVFLPRPLQERLVTAGIDCLMVVPDGAMHKLPLEALPLNLGNNPRYLLDVLPPVVYVPSAGVLKMLAEPDPVVPRGRSLLTVYDPVYPPLNDRVADAGQQGPLGANRGGLDSALQLTRGKFPPLPGTADESKAIQKLFPPEQIKELFQKTATKKSVVKEVMGKQVVHLACHGVALDEKNLFLALTADSDSGFLNFTDICSLPLKECQLAVLSACRTNVGEQRPLESPVTLASGFLSAGARRIVASHWNVPDKSTAELMAAFFKELKWEQGRPVSSAQALKRARLQVKANPNYSTPYYWAPFVVIGLPDGH